MHVHKLQCIGVGAVVVLLCLLPFSTHAASADTWVSRGFKALDKNQPSKALAYFEKALETGTASAELDTYIGLAHYKGESFNEALNAFERASARDPDVVDGAFLFYRANCFRALGLFVSEQRAWKALVAWDPDSRFADMARKALAQGLSGPPAGAVDLVETGNEICDPLPYASIAYFSEASLMPSGDSRDDAMVYLAYALNRTQQHEKVLALKPRTAIAGALSGIWNMQRVLAYAGLSRWGDAMAELNRVPASDEIAAQAEYLKTVCRIKMGHMPATARPVPELARVIDSEALNALTRLAHISAAAGASR